MKILNIIKIGLLVVFLMSVFTCLGHTEEKIYFVSSDPEHGTELWSFDGRKTVLEVDINPGPEDSTPRNLTVYDGILYFSATDGINGHEPWSYDGTEAQMIEDILPGGYGSNPRYFTVYDGTLYFRANSGYTSEEQQELYSFDGTTVERVIDTGPAYSNYSKELIVYNDLLYFLDWKDRKGAELWAYDGRKAKRRSRIWSYTMQYPYLTVYDDLTT
jgi:ELWxxDGT repeat protein